VETTGECKFQSLEREHPHCGDANIKIDSVISDVSFNPLNGNTTTAGFATSSLDFTATTVSIP